jgi:hypothetical protein
MKNKAFDFDDNIMNDVNVTLSLVFFDFDTTL